MEKAGYGGEEKLQNSTGRQIGFVVDRDRHQLTDRCSKLGLELGLLGGCLVAGAGAGAEVLLPRHQICHVNKSAGWGWVLSSPAGTDPNHR